MPTPHDYYSPYDPHPHLHNRHNNAPYIEPDWQASRAKDQLPAISTIGRGPRGTGLKLGDPVQTGNTFTIPILEDLNDEKIGEIGPITNGSINVRFSGSKLIIEYPHANFSTGEIAYETATYEIPNGETGSLIYPVAASLERNVDGVYEVQKSLFNVTEPNELRINDIAIFETYTGEVHYMTVATVDAITEDTVVCVAHLYFDYSNAYGDYNDLINSPLTWDEEANAWKPNGDLAIWDSISDEPELATVASTGDYEDLVNVPTNVTDFNNDADYQTAEEVAAAIEQASSSIYEYKGTVEHFADLPNDPNNGDVYLVEEAHGDNPAYTSYTWSESQNQWNPVMSSPSRVVGGTNTYRNVIINGGIGALSPINYLQYSVTSSEPIPNKYGTLLIATFANSSKPPTTPVSDWYYTLKCDGRELLIYNEGAAMHSDGTNMIPWDEKDALMFFCTGTEWLFLSGSSADYNNLINKPVEVVVATNAQVDAAVDAALAGRGR